MNCIDKGLDGLACLRGAVGQRDGYTEVSASNELVGETSGAETSGVAVRDVGKTGVRGRQGDVG